MRLPWILRVVADEWDRRTQAWAQKKVEGWDTEYLPPGKLTIIDDIDDDGIRGMISSDWVQPLDEWFEDE